jgi:hypothetical protein
MDSKFHQFLKESKIDPRRVLAASRELERLRREDREIRLKRRAARKAEGGEKASLPKPRSGRPLSEVTLARIAKGKSVTGPSKQRVLRAVNHLLSQKKQPAVELKALF